MIKSFTKIIVIYFFGIINYLISQSDSFISSSHGFSIYFPSEVHESILDDYSISFESLESIDESFFMYQVQIMNERPNSPLKFKTKEQNEFFLKSFLNNSSLFYENKIFYKKYFYLFDDKYFAMEHFFKGYWTAINQVVFNKGITILQNNRIIKIIFIYPENLNHKPIQNDKYNKFIKSFRLIE